MAKKIQKGSNDRQLRNEATKLLAIKDETERNAKLNLMSIVKSEKAERIKQLMVEIKAEKEGREKPAEVTVVEKITETESEAVPAEDKPTEVTVVEETIKTEPEATLVEHKPAEVEPETNIPTRNPGTLLWEGKKEEPKKERRVIKNNKVKMLASRVVRDEPTVKPGKAFIISLEEIMNNANGSGHVNAVYTQKKGIEMSVSTHAPFIHKTYGKIIPVIIQKSTVPSRRQPSRKLDEKDVGSWVKLNVPHWEDGIWMIRIGHTNILSDSPLNVNKDIMGLALISSKKVEQKGRKTQYFPHIIVLNTQDNIKPAFSLSINDAEGNADTSGQVHIGPTVAAKRDEQEVKEYLHLEPCEQ